MSGRLREILQELIGERLVDITDEPAESSLAEEGNAFMHLHFGNGTSLRIPVGETGFEVLEP